MSRFAHARAGGWLIPPFLIPAAALVVAGCGGGSNNASAGTTPAAPQPAKPVGAPGANVRVLTPGAGSIISGSTVRVRVRVTGFTLDPRAVGRPARQGFGHLHFSLDGGRYDAPRYSGANGAQAVRLGVQGKYSPSVTPAITYRHVRPGRHTLVVYLANNDHSLTGVTTKVTFTVRKPPPPPPVATTSAQTGTQAAAPTDTQVAPNGAPAPAPQSTPNPAPTPPSSGGGGAGIPQGGGGDGDADNSGGPDDGDGNQ
jgi:hypothetical protein